MINSVVLHSARKKDDFDDFLESLSKIKQLKFKNQMNFLILIFKKLFFERNNTNSIKFADLETLYFKRYKEKKIKIKTNPAVTAKTQVQQQNRSKTNEEHKKKEIDSDLSEGSDPRLESPTDRWKRVGEWIQEKKVDLGVWISRICRDHNINPNGKLDPASNLYKEIVKYYGCYFGNGSLFDYFVPKSKGLSFVMSMNKTGYLRLWINSKIDWNTFLEHFFNEFKFLDFEDQSRLLECFEMHNREVFLLETSNIIGPGPLIDDQFKGSLILVKRLPYRGNLHDIQIWIDYSTGEPEIEFRGPEGSCKRLQEIVSRPMEVAKTFGYIETILDTYLSSFELIDRKQNDIAQSINTKFSGLQSIIEEKHEETRGFFNKQLDQNQQLIQVTKKQTDTMQDRFDAQDQSIAELDQTVRWAQYDTVENVRQVSEKLNDLEMHIDLKFEDQNQTFRNNLYVVLHAIRKMPGTTANHILKTINKKKKIMSKTSLYDSLKELRESNIISAKKQKPLFRKRGRPRLKFKIKLEEV